MALLSPTDQQTLREMFADLKTPVTLRFFTQTIGCETCDETRLILSELTALTDRILVEEVNLVLDKDTAAAYGIDRARYGELLPVMASQALASGSPANNPRVPTSDEIIELYRRVYD